MFQKATQSLKLREAGSHKKVKSDCCCDCMSGAKQKLLGSLMGSRG